MASGFVFAQEADNIDRENNDSLDNFVQEIRVNPGETATIPVQGRIYIGPEYVTIGSGVSVGGRHDYDGNQMGYEVQARFSDESTDGSGQAIEFLEYSYGSGIIRHSGTYYVDNINRKVGDHISINQSRWYYFQYHNDTNQAIDITIRSYSWWA